MFALGFGITAGFKNPFQESLGFSIFMIGVLWAASRVGISTVLLFSGRLKKKLNFKQFIVVQAAMYSILFIAIGLVRSPWLVAILFLLPTIIRWGFSSLRSHFYLEFIEDSKYKVSLLSMNTFFANIMTGIVGLIMGYSVLNFGYNYSYLLAGLLFSLITSLVIIFLKKPKSYSK